MSYKGNLLDRLFTVDSQQRGFLFYGSPTEESDKDYWERLHLEKGEILRRLELLRWFEENP